MKRSQFYFALIILMILSMSSPVWAQTEPDLPWWNDRVFYEIFVRSFYDSDGDGIGDFRGIIEKLDYLNDGDPTTDTDLGITGLWLMPINPSPSYHGYDVTDYYETNPDYGSLADFKELIEAAHARGIAVIIDLVINHTSVEHPWFKSSAKQEGPYDDWYIWVDENPGYLGPWNEPAWHSRGGRYYYGVFWSGMPDLNYQNPDVTSEMYGIADFWLEEVGVDGFRLDAVKHIVEEGALQDNTTSTLLWLQNFQQHLKETDSDVLTVGEFFNTSTDRLAPFIEAQSVSIAFDFDFAARLLGSISRGDNRDIQRQLKKLITTYPEAQYALFLANHDQARLNTQLIENIGRNKLAASILLTSPGVPFVYYGEEIGMVGGKPDERIRTPMQWTPDPKTAGFSTAVKPWEALQEHVDLYNVATQTSASDSLLNHFRGLIQLRNKYAALRNGDLQIVESSNRRILSFIRQNEESTILVIINMNRNPVSDFSLSLEEGYINPGEMKLIFGTADIRLPLIETGQFKDYKVVDELEGFGTLIIQLQ